MVSIIRWFEQITEAVDRHWWNKTTLLLVVPPAVWFFKSQVSAGRPTAVPLHEPVQGFGAGPAMPGDMPKPPKKKRAAVDPEAIAKLKAKLKEQGMLQDDDNPNSQS
jgi:hypothetical protein